MNKTERVGVAIGSPNTMRITFTYPLLNHTLEVAFLVSGEEKAGILRDVIKPSRPMSYPAQLVGQTNGRLLWNVDKTAARLL